MILLCAASACEKSTLPIDAATCDGALGCGKCGEKGNELGVGRYCTTSGDECSDTDAILCTVWYEKSAPPFCTLPCKIDKDCGTSAYCGTNPDNPSQRGCTPFSCGVPDDAMPTDAIP
jgi:hypothetical protein